MKSTGRANSRSPVGPTGRICHHRWPVAAEKVDEGMGMAAQVADAMPAGQRSGMEQDATCPGKSHDGLLLFRWTSVSHANHLGRVLIQKPLDFLPKPRLVFDVGHVADARHHDHLGVRQPFREFGRDTRGGLTASSSPTKTRHGT